MLTLRQIEVIRAIMVTGSVGGAARLLNVSSPGISRVMKHAEAMLGLKLFSRKAGRYTPTSEANDIFDQINSVYDKVEDLHFLVKRLKRGADAELKIGSVPSISNVMVPRAVADVRRKYPNLLIDIDILKIEEAINYLLLGKGEIVAVSHKVEHPMLTFEPLAKGRLKCIVPKGHPLAHRDRVSADQIVKYPLIGIDPNDPYGRIMAGIFSNHALSYEVTIRARFGSTVCALVTSGLGVAIIDEFTLAADNWPNLRALEIVEPTVFETYIAYRKDTTLSSYCAFFVASLRGHMQSQRCGAEPDRSATSPRDAFHRK
ncbi:MAG TPA: LysR family transcriptional regulator [Hyphomicrobiaceae bacterium]|nr:LysR family transcriptional regulator [Hyphomicrobiaceae bacterium]